MENSEFANHVRQHRSSGVVLKAQVSNIRSRNRMATIAVVEGATDLGPYEVWIDRVQHEGNYKERLTWDVEGSSVAGCESLLSSGGVARLVPLGSE